MSSRRTFMQQALGGSAVLAASGLFPSSRVLGANDRIRIALIGGGGRGSRFSRPRWSAPTWKGWRWRTFTRAAWMK